MLRSIFVTRVLEPYHSAMLLVKMRPSSAPATAVAMLSAGVLASPGLSALSIFDRAGVVKRATPLSRRSSKIEPARALTAFATLTEAAAYREDKDSRIDSGVSLLELHRDSDVADLQMALAKDPNVEYVSRVPIRYLLVPRKQAAVPPPSTITATPPPAATMWNLRKIQWAEARARGGFKDAQAIHVAVLDTGVQSDHPDLKGRINRYIFEHPDLPDASSDQDLVGHGTHVSGTIGALINNDIGINGICSCEINVWKIFNDKTTLIEDSGFEYFAYVVDPIMYRRALADCADQTPDVINLSIGGPGRPDPQERDLFNSIIANGTSVVAAMGNSRQAGSPTSYPAAIPGVIGIGATGLNDVVAKFSNRGNHIAISAPGVGIWSTLPTYAGQTGFGAVRGPNGDTIEGKPMSRETEYAAWDGTSMATPHVTACSALLLAKNGKMKPSGPCPTLV